MTVPNFLKGRQMIQSETKKGFLLILPLIIILALLTLYPFFYLIITSLKFWNLTNPDATRFIGLGNFWKIIKDGRFWNALKNTGLYTVGAVGIEFLLGYFIALLITRDFRGKNVIRALFILPMIATPAPMAMVWRQIYDPTLGLANYFLRLVGFQPLLWTSDSSTALLSIMLVDIWKWTPFFILTLSAGLSALPTDVTEAAEIDGASGLQILFRVVSPMLRLLIITVLIFRIMDVMKEYDLIYVLTEGGPGISTETMNYYIYLTSFRWLRMGSGSALAVILLFITLFIGLRLMKLAGRTEE